MIALQNIIICNQSEPIFDIINILDTPIYINNNSHSIQGELLGMQQTQQFTIQFWVKISNMNNQTPLDLFTLMNILPQQREQQYDQTYPNCPYSLSFLQKNPEYQKIPNVMSNPNCFGKQQIQNNDQQETQGVMKASVIPQNNKQNLQLLYVSKNQNQANQNILALPLIEIKNQGWFFCAISFDYKNNKGTYIVDFDNNATTQTFDLNMPNFQLMKNFIVYASENQQVKQESQPQMLYDLNVHPVYFEDLTLLKFFNYDQDTTTSNNNLVRLDFNKTKNKQIKSEGVLEQKFKIKGNFVYQNSKNLLKSAYLSLGNVMKDLLPNLLIQSPTFYYSFKVVDMNELILLKIQLKKSFIEIGLKKNEKKNLNFFVRSSDDFGIQFQSEKSLNLNSFNRIAFSIINLFAQSKVQIWYQDGTYESTVAFKQELDFKKYSYQIFDNSQDYELEIFDFRILSNPYSFVLQKKITEYTDQCELYQVPSHSETNICLTCKNKVLNEQNQCVDFCLKDHKNINNTCVPCVEENCKEIEYPKFIIENEDGLEFKISLDKPLYKKTLQDLSKQLQIKVSSLKPEDYTYSILPVNKNQIDLQINTEKSIYNSTLEVSINSKQVKDLYTLKREKINELKGSFQVNSLRVLHTYQEMVLDIICSIIIIIFWVLVLFGILLTVLQFKYSFEDYSFKRLYYVFINIQFISLLAFADVPYPSNFNFFCNKIFEYTIKCFGMIKFQDPQLDRVLPFKLQNISSKMFSILLVENITFVSVLHLFIMITYFITLIFSFIHKISPFRPKNRERLFTTRDVFEFSFLAMSFLVFTPVIFGYLVLNLKYQKQLDSQDQHQVSFIVSMAYLILYGLGLFFFFIFYLIKKGFKHHSNIKNKLHFLFNGYQESKNANMYEVSQIILTVLTSIVLTGLSTKQAPQLTFLVFLQILKVVFISCLKPFMSKWDKFAEVFEKFLWTVVYLGIASLSVFDENKQDQIRVKIGWGIVGIIAFQLFIDFISHFMFCLRYVTNMKKPENIIFYQKTYHFKKLGDEKNNHTLIESQNHGSSFFLDENEKLNDVKVNPYKNKEKKNKSFISDQKISNEDNENNNDIEFENLKSGQGTLHESYISQSSKSVDKNDNFNQSGKLYTLEMKRHLLIGNGKMGSAFINKIKSKFDMTVISPNSKPNYKSQYYKSIQEMQQEIKDPFDIITFGLKPNKIENILNELDGKCYTNDTNFISLAAGVRTSLYKKFLGNDKKINIVMTNLPVEIGQGILGIYPKDIKLDFLEDLGQNIYLENEDDIDKFCSLIACGSGFCYKILDMYQDNAKYLNFKSKIDYQNLIIQLFQGSLELVKSKQNCTFEDKLDQVINPGGPTDIGVKYLNLSNENFKNCLIKAKDRTQQIGKEVNPKDDQILLVYINIFFILSSYKSGYQIYIYLYQIIYIFNHYKDSIIKNILLFNIIMFYIQFIQYNINNKQQN